MRLTSAVLGILGGLAGVGVHAVLLVRFFSQSHGLFQVFVEMLLALPLGLAAILVAALCRRSPKTLTVFLPLFGILGFFPRPVSWIPAGVLLIAGGVVALVALWMESRELRPASHPAAPLGPAEAPLHWSEAARLGIPHSPVGLVGKTSGERRRAGRWSIHRKVGAVAVAVLTIAIVIPLSIGTITLDREIQPVATGGGSPATTVSSAATQTTTASTTTTTGPPGQEGFSWYRDVEYGFAIKFPISWRNSDPSEVGQRLQRRTMEAYADALAPVAFADWSSPTFNGCYLDYIWVEIYDETLVQVPTLPEFRSYIRERIDHLRSRYAGVESIEPLRDLVVAGMPGAEHVWSIHYGGRTLMLKECVLVNEERAYFLQFAAVEEDWAEYRPLFEEILRDFTVTGPEPVG